MKYLHPALDDEKAEVNLTPMLDVVFIMLVFFIVTASFIREVGISLTLPQGSAPLAPELESITIVVEPASAFVVNGRPVSRGGLLPYVHALYAQNPDATFGVVLKKGSIVRDMVAAADAGRALGFDVIPIMKED
ncbi:MAG: biopolymer transporter ExbD [Woeseiaceae bacterium]|nr:biopolymer transporter ExbD [Woeseiaceae bacterium]